MRGCPLTLHFSQICGSNAPTKKIEIANYKFWVYNHHRVRRCLPQIMAVSSQYLLHLLCMNFSSIGHTFIELLTGRLASCWLLSAAKATISSAVPMSTQLCVSDCVPCVFFRCFGLRSSVCSGKRRKQIFPISPPFCHCWRSQYCLFLVPGHTFNPLTQCLAQKPQENETLLQQTKLFKILFCLQDLYFSPFWRQSDRGPSLCGLPVEFMFAVGNVSVLSNRFVVKSLPP